MRIKFKKGKQKELINKIKDDNNFSWADFSKFLNVSKSSLIEYSREKNLIPLEVYERLDKKGAYKSDIVEIKEDNLGRSKGGMNSSGSLVHLKIPRKNKELAELIGMILGDGHICSYKKGKKVGVYSLKIAGDCKKDKDYHLNYIKPLCMRLFDIDIKVQESQKNNERFVCLYSRKLIEFLSTLGLKSGDKIANKSTIPRWVFRDVLFLKACIKGLIDTDGSIFRMSKKDPNLLRINFTNHNPVLLNDTRKAFVELGFNPTKIINNRQFHISRKKDLARYINDIGFSNSKHSKRVQEFNSPVV